MTDYSQPGSHATPFKCDYPGHDSNYPIPRVTCNACTGRGEWIIKVDDGDLHIDDMIETCGTCKGCGHIHPDVSADSTVEYDSVTQTYTVRPKGYYDFALSLPAVTVPRPIIDGWFITVAGGLYQVMDDHSAICRAGTGAQYTAPADVIDRIQRGEWRMVVSPELSRRRPSLNLPKDIRKETND